MEEITREKFEEIFETVKSEWDGDNAYQGLNILAKYTNNLIQGAGHDIIWCIDVDEVIKLGITEEDVTSLAKLNWIIEEDNYLACFV